jgi:two-component system response regulator NreC
MPERTRETGGKTRIRILLADDHAVLRAGLKLLINAQPDMEVVGEAATTGEAPRLIEETQPDIAVVDLTMPGGGLGLVEQIYVRYPATRVLVLTMHDDPAYLRSALAAGAAGYIVKHAADTELLSSLRAVHEGATIVYLAGARSSVREMAGADRPRRGPRRGALSAREREVLVLLARGYTNRQIGEQLAVSVKSVETYRARLAKKLGLRNRPDMVKYALGTGLMSGQPDTATS